MGEHALPQSSPASATAAADAEAAEKHHFRRADSAEPYRQAPLYFPKPPGLGLSSDDGSNPGSPQRPSLRSPVKQQDSRSPSRPRRASDASRAPYHTAEPSRSPAKPRSRSDQPVGEQRHSCSPSVNGNAVDISSELGSASSQEVQRQWRDSLPVKDASVQPQPPGGLLRAAVAAAVSPSKPAPKTLVSGGAKPPRRRSAASTDLDKQLQEERERSQRAEQQLDQLAQALQEEKSASQALLAEREALTRLQAELAERCTLLELKARMLEENSGQLLEEDFSDDLETPPLSPTSSVPFISSFSDTTMSPSS